MPSTVIRWFSYRADQRQLDITFQSGRRYVYDDVPADVYESMRKAFSKGEFFNKHIRDRYTFTERSSAGPDASSRDRP
jgi:lysyl-tRNA synthetase class 2